MIGCEILRHQFYRHRHRRCVGAPHDGIHHRARQVQIKGIAKGVRLGFAQALSPGTPARHAVPAHLIAAQSGENIQHGALGDLAHPAGGQLHALARFADVALLFQSLGHFFEGLHLPGGGFVHQLLHTLLVNLIRIAAPKHAFEGVFQGFQTLEPFDHAQGFLEGEGLFALKWEWIAHAVLLHGLLQMLHEFS